MQQRYKGRHKGDADVLIATAVAFLISTSSPTVFAQSANDNPRRAQDSALPLQFSPKGVRRLQEVGEGLVQMDAQSNSMRAMPAGPFRRIYNTSGPSTRAAQLRVIEDEDRKAASASPQNAPLLPSQRLMGAPREWQQLEHKIDQMPVPARPLLMTPTPLSSPVKDQVALQMIGLHPAPQTGNESPFPDILHLLPHKVEADIARFLQKRWPVLTTAAVLDGGYPAGAVATDR